MNLVCRRSEHRMCKYKKCTNKKWERMWSGHHEQAQPAASGGAGTRDTTAELNLNFAWVKLLLVAYSAANLSQLSRSSLDLSSACERPLYLIYICDKFFISQHASKMDNSAFIFLTCLIQTCKQACKTMCKSCLMHSCPWEIHSRLFFFFFKLDLETSEQPRVWSRLTAMQNDCFQRRVLTKAQQE